MSVMSEGATMVRGLRWLFGSRGGASAEAGVFEGAEANPDLTFASEGFAIIATRRPGDPATRRPGDKCARIGALESPAFLTA